MTQAKTGTKAEAISDPSTAPSEAGGSKAFLPLVATLALAGLWLASADPKGAQVGAPAPTPVAAAERTCGDEDAPEARGREALAEARAHMGRYPFAPEEGLRALALAGEAERCLMAAGSGLAQRAAERERRWLDRIERDYAAMRIRLHRALELDDRDEARREARALARLLQGREDAYTTWLARIQRALTRGEKP